MTFFEYFAFTAAMPELVLPDGRYKDSYLEALREFHAEGRNLEWKIDELDRDFTRLLERLEKNTKAIDLPDEHVASAQYWLVEDDQYLGRVNIRPELTPLLEEEGGNIGYEVRPSARRKGYGHLLLHEALKIARRNHNIDLALVTCDADNEASQRIIKAAGGIQIYPLGAVRKFWVPTCV
jgi:predicted acetyltransferase